ncbi:MAG: hypothetical protein AUJ92_11510 [Armatimonadetes bacterium CG2_30_59_28]|nr:hypothetical protein [Armatimonadota bacterium]OIO93828.1 MAG: hypothetical protein AUJ92_11510 [Armatimonadetes bacterium CG2_30_59_28]PIU65162.1 MAG: hypothetical protein COS85_09820 [Armatimonadetes bacterium CG07_land_8_20_14_0_80_59_28]PIX38747.1 MAG: hypothetical protein COZ56_19660 [Armatimonadetes bacterium CG_4_8_14_3_um_filter_58_9]PJB78614.1 MAG: hypothetical protein CO095_00310 [Armatimonadetes bacterium CG_4_9_14_3_um_filter_58_7]
MDDPKTKVSLYYHKGESALMVVTNYNKEERQARLDLSLDRLGLQGKALSAKNMMTDEVHKVGRAGSLSLRIPAKSFVLLRVE